MNLWNAGESYKFRVVDNSTRELTIYTGIILMQDEKRIKISDLKGKEVVIHKEEIRRSTRI